jgi:TPR repeat protein
VSRSRFESVGLLWAIALCFGAAPASSGRDRGVAALRLELARDGASAPRAALDAQYATACAEGWAPACHPESWRPEGRTDLASAAAALTEACAHGDPGSCTVVGWEADAIGRKGGSDAVSEFRKAARLWKGACDNDGFLPACHEYAGMLYENRGVTADPAAGVFRWKAACDKGEGASCERLAELSATGAGTVRKDVREAARYAGKGCALGSLAACRVKDDLAPPADPVAASEDLCKRGLLAACAVLAGSGEVAVGTPSYEWTDAACAIGDGPSCLRIGTALAASGDAAGASQRYDAACIAGSVEGCTELDKSLAQAKTPAVDATNEYRAACLLGGAVEACTTLGVATMDGVVPRDPDTARLLLERACSDTAGSTACAALGRGYEQALVGERDRTQAVHFYGKACAQGDLASCERRGDLLVEGVGVKRDDGVALGNYRQACDGGVAVACRKAAVILDEGEEKVRDREQAVALYRQACTEGDAPGCLGLGRMLEEGVEGAPDFAGARDAYRKAVDADLREARSALARLLWNGLGGPRQGGRARQLAKEACQQGDLRACQGPKGL